MNQRSSIMNEMGKDNEAPFFPEEIIKNIHKRLPVKSLVRFQCVCKHWKHLIRSRSFIDEHLHHSSHKNPSLLFPQDLLRFYLIDCKLQLQGRELRNHPSINPLNNASMIVGSCNGLLCVEIDRYNTSPPPILLWNPANREVRHVPITSKYTDSDRCVIVFGFGFSRAIDDYKIVRTHAEFLDTIDRVEVFSLRRGSWKGMRIGKLKGVKIYSHGVTVNGVIFWIGSKEGKVEDESEENENNTEGDEDASEEDEDGSEEDEYDMTDDEDDSEEDEDGSEEDEDGSEEDEDDTEEDEDGTEEGEDGTEEGEDDTEEGEDDTAERKVDTDVIVSFDIANEVFTLMPMPVLGKDAIKKLTVYENKLAMLCKVRRVNGERSNVIDLWVMEESSCASGERWSWRKVYTIDPLLALYPVTIWRNEIVCQYKSHVLVMLNITTNHVRRFDFPHWVDVYDMWNYAESLVSVCNYS